MLSMVFALALATAVGNVAAIGRLMGIARALDDGPIVR
jgi:hypothetical protein